MGLDGLCPDCRRGYRGTRNQMGSMGGTELDKLTRASIDLSEAAANYGALKVVFGVFMAVVLLIVLLFAWQTFSTQGKLAAIEKASKKSLEYFSELNNHTIGRDEAKLILQDSLGKSEALTKYYILKIRLENHVDDKQFTEDKIRMIVDNDFSARRQFLSRFSCEGKSVSSAVLLDDNMALSKLMRDWVYKPEGEFTVSLMAQAVSLYYDGVRIKSTGRIDGMK